jgi:hypothetical protein
MDPTKFPSDESGAPSGQPSESGDTGSATGMFSTPPKTDASSSILDSLRSDARLIQELQGPQASPTVFEPRPSPASEASSPATTGSEPGEFTRIYQTMPFAPPAAAPSSDGVKPFAGSSPAEPPAAQPKRQPLGDFTKLFTQLPTPRSTVVRPAAPPRPEPVTPTTAPTAMPAAPGEFTQMFQGLGQGPAPAQTTPASSPSRPRGPLSQPPLDSPGIKAEIEPQAEAGNFTQLFQSISPQSPAEAKAPASPSFKEPAAPTPPSESRSFTNLFQTAQPQPRSEPAFSPPPREPKQPQFNQDLATPGTGGSAPGQGGFTKMFESLSEDRVKDPPFSVARQGISVPEPSPAPAAPLSPPMHAGPGEFTRLMQSLSEPAAPSAGAASISSPSPLFPPAPPSPAVPPPQQGPGEFTRVLSNAALREAQGRVPAAAPPQSQPPAAAAYPQMAPLPQQPVFAPPQRPAMPPTPAFQAPTFAPPQPPAAPAPTQGSKFQEYLPILIVINIFVLLVVVLIVIFVLRHH